MMGTVGIHGAMHPGGLFYSTATIRQELERIAGGWPERGRRAVVGRRRRLRRSVPRLRHDLSQTRPPCDAARATADAAADALFRGAGVVVVTLGLIETWRSAGDRRTRSARSRIRPCSRRSAPAFHRLTVTEMLEDLERIRTVVRDTLGADAGRDDLAGAAAHDVHRRSTSGSRTPSRRAASGRPSPSSSIATRTSTTSTRTRWSSPRSARATTSATTAGTSTATRSSTSSPSSCACSPTRRCS